MKFFLDKLINSKLYLIIIVTILAVLFSEILVYLQLSIFWPKDSHYVGYWLGFWTPLIDGLVISMLIIYIRSLYEKRLQRKTKLLNQSQQIAHIGSIYFDIKKNKTTCSDEIFNILELPNKNISPSNDIFLKYVYSDDKELINKTYEKKYEKNNYQIEYRIQTSNKKIKWIRETCYIESDQQNLPTTSISTIQDITEEYQKNEQLREKDSQLNQQFKLAEMGEMIGNIAHQWRQPLNLISTIASTIKFKCEFEQIEKEYIISNTNTILKQTQYLSQTIDNFRDFLKKDISLSFISVKDTISKTVSLIDAKLKTNHIDLVLNINDDLDINANQNELIEAFINIINNSADVLKSIDIKEKVLFINTNYLEDEDAISLEFIDNGGGIDENIINRILEPYFTTKFKSQGTGLGLSITNKIIVERHRGKISVSNKTFTYNKETYKGACFSIILLNNWNYAI